MNIKEKLKYMSTNEQNKRAIDELIVKHNLEFETFAYEAFLNHLRVLNKRMESSEQIDNIDKELMSEVTSEAFLIVDELLGSLDLQSTEISQSERFLVGTHIQLAINQRKEG